MSPSIRTYLLINLLLSVTLITSLAIIGNLFLAHKDIKAQLDAQLIRTTIRMKAFFSTPHTPANFRIIQKQLNNEIKLADQYKSDSPITSLSAIKTAIHSLKFQLWDQNNKLILHSKDASSRPLSSGQPGLSTLWRNGEAWYISTTAIPNTHDTLMLAERADYRQELENRLTQDSIIIMLITYPFLGLLIWIIVGRGLETLRRVAKEVHERAPAYLKPVDIESVPTKIEPLVRELNSLFHRLRAAFDREKRFTADAAHELKTPLAALSAQTQVALRTTDDNAKKEALLKVLSGVRRSTHVVQQLLTLSRLEPEAGLTETTPVRLAKQAAIVASMLAPEAIKKNIELELLTPDSQATIQGNATAIDILIRNLVDNAIRYSPANSFVKIAIKETPSKVLLIVTDNGPGVPEDLRKRVFERFYRVIGNNTMGSGLGLSIVQQIVKLHHGHIHLVTPESGIGTEFRIVFPK